MHGFVAGLVKNEVGRKETMSGKNAKSGPSTLRSLFGDVNVDVDDDFDFEEQRQCLRPKVVQKSQPEDACAAKVLQSSADVIGSFRGRGFQVVDKLLEFSFAKEGGEKKFLRLIFGSVSDLLG